MIHKPTELFFFVGHRLDKEPVETWRQYGPLFRTYSTHSITPELLAALEQSEAELAAGQLVSGDEVLRELDESIARMEAKRAGGAPRRAVTRR